MCTSIQRLVVVAGMVMPCEGQMWRKNVRFNLQENRVCYFRENSAMSDLSTISLTTTNTSRWLLAAEKDNHCNIPKMPRRYQNTDNFPAEKKVVTENVPCMPRRRNSYIIVANQSSTARAAWDWSRWNQRLISLCQSLVDIVQKLWGEFPPWS